MSLRAVADVHEVLLAGPPAAHSALIERLATDGDRLWPTERWPAMRLDAGLTRGSSGGHGSIRYHVAEHEPGRAVRFVFDAPAGLVGDHGFRLLEAGGAGTLLRHELIAEPTGAMRLLWPVLWRPLHDALIEDALALAAGRAAGLPALRRRVRALRWVAARRQRSR